MSRETENTETTDGFDSSPAQQRVADDAIFDPGAMLREMTGGVVTTKPAAKPQPASQPRQEQQPDPETEQLEEQTEQNEEQTEEETADPTYEDVLKDPSKFLKAHVEMKAKGTARDGVLAEVRELLGVTDTNEVKARLEALREQAMDNEIPVTAPTPARPLSNVRNEKEMAAAIDYYKKQHDWCVANREGGVFEFIDENGKPAEREVDEEWVKGQLAYAMDVLTTKVPERRKFIDLLKAETAKADPVYPFFTPSAPADTRAPLEELIKDLDVWVPEFRHYPRIAQLLGDATVGALVRLGKHGASAKEGKIQVLSLTNGKAPAATAPVRKLPPVTHKTSMAPGRKATPQEEASDKAAAHLRDGDRDGAFREMILQQISSA